MQGWLWAAVFALFAWTLQRLLSKVALADLGTRKFYLLSATVSLLTYLPYLLLRPPTVAELPPAFWLACLMAVTFGVTTEAIRRGQLIGGVVGIVLNAIGGLLTIFLLANR